MTRSEARALAVFTFVVLIVVLGLQSLITRHNAFWEPPDRAVAGRVR